MCRHSMILGQSSIPPPFNIDTTPPRKLVKSATSTHTPKMANSCLEENLLHQADFEEICYPTPIFRRFAFTMPYEN